MYEDNIKKLIQSEILQSGRDSQFDVSPNPAHTHNKIDSLPVVFNNLEQRTRFIEYRLVDSATTLTTGTKVGGDFVMPFAGYVMLETNLVGATVDTAGTTGTMSVDINKNGTTILGNKITIDTTEKTSRTATTPPQVSAYQNTFIIGDIFTFDVDTVQTTPAMGLTVFIKAVETSV